MLRRITLGLVLLGSPAAAQTWHASYVFTVAGVTVMESQVDLIPGRPGAGYAIETRTRGRGVASLIFRGEQVSRSEGIWRGAVPVPRLHRSSGNWRGSVRRTALEYSATGVPRVVTLEPAQDMERTPIPAEALPGSLDALSALLQLSRQVRDTGRCDARAQIYDGRRLTALELTTDPERDPEGGGLPTCVIESRLVAGIPVERSDDARPMRSVIHFGLPAADGPALPLRIELASRWWGTIQVALTALTRD
ncbi:MAG: hypothetical protein JWR10_2157 [Rubritepida sp.]|nr:hypothetical protein [Rubritepida sp.]